MEETKFKEQAPGFPPNALQEARSLIGVPLRRQDHQWNTEANSDNVRQFCQGLGDANPLFCDPDYGKSTHWGRSLAPGCFLYSVDSTAVAPKLRGIQWMYGGTEWEWYQPLRHGDRFSTMVRLIDAKEKQGSHAKTFILQIGESLFYNQNGELVAKAISTMARTARSRATDGLKYKSREAHRYSPEELQQIAADIEAEAIRGATPRYWEEVSAGDVLQPVVKGPLNITDMICWYAGAGHTYQALEIAYFHRKRHPADAYIDPDTGAQDNPARGHAQDFMAREVGMPAGYDVGTQRISWLGHLITNWIGDSGFCRSMNVRLQRPNIFGDVSWCRGKIQDKRSEDGRHVVDIELLVQNQLGEVTAKGSAVVALPARQSRA